MRPDVTVVTPVHNDAATLAELCARVRAAFAGRPCEIVAVDDASEDGSFEVMQRLGVVAVRLSGSGGQNAAILEGLRRARGRFCCVLDADLDDPPEALPRLVAAVEQGDARVAFSSRDGHGTWTSALFRRAMHAIFPGLPRHACLCFALDAHAAADVVRTARAGDYLVAVIGALRLPSCEVGVRRVDRANGRPSGYAGLKRARHAAQLLLSALRLRLT